MYVTQWRKKKTATTECNYYNNLIISSDCYALHSQHCYGQIYSKHFQYIRCWKTILNRFLNIIIIRKTIPFCRYHYNNMYLLSLQSFHLCIFSSVRFSLRFFLLSHINATSDNVTMFKLLNFPRFFFYLLLCYQFRLHLSMHSNMESTTTIPVTWRVNMKPETVMLSKVSFDYITILLFTKSFDLILIFRMLRNSWIFFF